jgi:large subunit ribosomal protein L25
MEAKSLTIESRKDTGKNVSRKLRREGYIPGVIYSHGQAEAIRFPSKEFAKLFKGKISESIIFDLHDLAGKDHEEKMAYVKDYQVDPVTNEILHVDLFKVTANEKIHTNVPIEFVGTAKGSKMGGILEVEAREIIVECLPRDLPEKILIDVSDLNTGDSIHVRDIHAGEKVRILSNPEAAIVTVIIPKIAAVEEKVEEAAVAAAEGGEVKEEAPTEEKSEE